MPEPRPQQLVDASYPPDTAEEPRFVCDLCSRTFTGLPEGSGLFMWTRGSEIRTEEPPLCRTCASKLILGAYRVYEDDGSEE